MYIQSASIEFKHIAYVFTKIIAAKGAALESTILSVVCVGGCELIDLETAWCCITISISAAILITGGWFTKESAELFTPLDNMTCELPPLPDRRYRHVQSGNMMCGGGYTGTERSCIRWSTEQGAWVTLPVNLGQEREYSSVWRVSQDQSLVIMGSYSGAARKTSETVSSDGVSTRPSFNMKYTTR